MTRPGWHQFVSLPTPKLRCLAATATRRRLLPSNQQRQYKQGSGNGNSSTRGGGGAPGAWPLLKRRSKTRRAPADSTTPQELDADADDATFAAALERAYPSAKDRALSTATIDTPSKIRSRPRASGISWSQLEENAERLNLGGAEGAALLGGNKGRELSRTPTKSSKGLSRDDRNMLFFVGMSPNLSSSDFYRLGPSSLSGWANTIKKVQQVRDPKTLEPLGRYIVSFDTGAAASSYYNNIKDLHQLACHRAASPTGLWQSTVPVALRGPPTTPTPDLASDEAQLEAAAESYSLSPPSPNSLRVSRRWHNGQRRPWSYFLSKFLSPLDHGPRPPTVLLQVYPPGPEEADIARMIREDGSKNDLPWRVSPPRSLVHLHAQSAVDRSSRAGLTGNTGVQEAGTSSAVAGQDAAAEIEEGSNSRQPPAERRPDDNILSRFVVACETDWEARRFHRRWNQREVNIGSPEEEQRHVIRASVIQW